MIPTALSLNLREFSRSDLLPTVVVGLLIVFSVLAIIYVCLVIMERVFRKNNAPETNAVTAPLGGTVNALSPEGAVSEGSVVAVLRDKNGADYEIMSPVSGTLKFKVQNGATVRKNDTLFWVE